jgi:hypothetical protein
MASRSDFSGRGRILQPGKDQAEAGALVARNPALFRDFDDPAQSAAK